jgi:Xaa-Pro aminopeptidase
MKGRKTAAAGTKSGGASSTRAKRGAGRARLSRGGLSRGVAGIPAPYSERIAALRTECERRRLDGYLVLNRMDQFWLTGFTGEDGMVLVTPRAVLLLTDGRFTEAASIQAPYAKAVLRKVRTQQENGQIIGKHKLERVGFDPAQMSVADFDGLKKAVKPTRLVAAGGVIGQMRVRKDEEEVGALGKAIDIAQEAFGRLREWIAPGVTEQRVAARLEYEMKMLGAQGPSFPTIVAFGANASLPHYEPGERVLAEGDAILIDWGAQVGWYCSDLTRMLWVGKPPREMVKINAVVREAHDRAIVAAQAGMTAHALDKVARDVIRKAGYGKQFAHSLGHGLGLDVHESPRVGMGSETVLEPGMVVTIEPGVYVPGVGGVRIEDDILITEDGCRVLTSMEIETPK